ncbi:hypothetical protein TWF730_005303 [Orbilia blumenaviensis]|uniref:Peptidase S8/S53 domain-containing protein n=1 Tax=Orbilia blumenaviensis TaxID=1796055 RepID=A0AAV9VJ59_9PEZI
MREIGSKIGTLETIFTQWAFILDRAYRLDKAEIDEFVQYLQKEGYSMPPRRHSIYQVRSEGLGTWVITIDTIQNEPADMTKILNKFTKIIIAGGKVPIIFNYAGSRNRNLHWLDPEAAPRLPGDAAAADPERKRRRRRRFSHQDFQNSSPQNDKRQAPPEDNAADDEPSTGQYGDYPDFFRPEEDEPDPRTPYGQYGDIPNHVILQEEDGPTPEDVPPVRNVENQQPAPEPDNLPVGLYSMYTPITGDELGDEMTSRTIAVLAEPAPELLLSCTARERPDIIPDELYIDYWAGAGSVAYVIDTGLDFEHDEVGHLTSEFMLHPESSRKWIFTGPLPGDERSDGSRHFFSEVHGIDTELHAHGRIHGTQMVSKLASPFIGFSRWSNVVVVKIQSGRNSVTPLNDLESLLKIYDNFEYRMDQEQYDRIKGAVIVHTRSFLFRRHDAFERAYLYLLQEILEFLGGKNVYFFTATEGGTPDQEIKRHPAALILAGQRVSSRAFTKATVVGGISQRTKLNVFQTDPNIKIYAPATKIWAPVICDPLSAHRFDAETGLEATLRKFSGPSYATAHAASMCALFMSRGWQNPLERMEELAYNRTENGPKVIWNGIKRAAQRRALDRIFTIESRSRRDHRGLGEPGRFASDRYDRYPHPAIEKK